MAKLLTPALRILTLNRFESRSTTFRPTQTAFTLHTLRRAQSPPSAMAAATRVLPCDGTSISFTDDVPHISSEETRQAISAAADHLNALQTVVFPTETVYGLGALATNSLASSRIFSTKGRPPDNPLIVHVSSSSMLQALLPPGYTLPPTYHTLIRRFWPGPLTLLFPRDPIKVPDIITAGQKTVAVRMPSHPVARALIALTGIPLAAPSANSSGKPSPTTAQHVVPDLGGKLGIILDGGPCDVGVESTVVDGLGEDGHIRVLRPGGVTVEQIEEALREEGGDHRVLVHKRDYTDEAMEAVPTTPGMKYRHYSPSVPVVLLQTRPPPNGVTAPSTTAYFDSLFRRREHGPALKVGVLCLDDSPFGRQVRALQHPQISVFSLGPANHLSVAARRLFDGLISLEQQQGVHFMLIEEMEERDEGLAVMNRVRKAASETECIDTSK